MKKEINLLPYSALTIVNMAVCSYFLNFELAHIIVILFASFVLNQYMLVVGIRNLLDDDGQKTKSIIFLSGKIFILVGGFWFASRYAEEHIIIFVTNYIFQLLILGISIKS